MIAYTMIYTAAVGVPVFLAAWALASVLRRYGRPERLVWLAGLGLAFALPLVALLAGAPVTDAMGGAAGGASGTGVIGLPEILVVPGGVGGAGLGALLLALWIGTSALLTVRLLVAALRLVRAGRAWHAGTLDGIEVWHTQRMGPAVAGLFRPRILVPEWLADMPAHDRSLVLLHEQEHIRARDPWLMLMSRLAPVLVPWNPAVWMLSWHLLRAIELDCDRRVLRHRPDVRAYGRTLIEISSRDSGRLVAVAAFAESEAPLRSRILSLTTPARTVSTTALLAGALVSATLVVAACEIPVPTSDEITAPEAVEAAPSEADIAEADIAETQERAVERPVYAEEVIEQLRSGAIAADLDAALRERRRPEAPDGVQTDPPVSEPQVGPPIDDGPTFTPFTVAPRLQNIADVQATLVREYPTVLRDAGIGGRVLLWFLIGEDGLVRRTLINQSSGHEALDQAALNVASTYRFSPAMNRENRVAVWVALPITFQVR